MKRSRRFGSWVRVPTGQPDQIPIGTCLFSLTNRPFGACARTIGFVVPKLIVSSFEAATSFASRGEGAPSMETFAGGDGRKCPNPKLSTMQRNGSKMKMVVGQSANDAEPFGSGRDKHVSAKMALNVAPFGRAGRWASQGTHELRHHCSEAKSLDAETRSCAHAGSLWATHADRWLIMVPAKP